MGRVVSKENRLLVRGGFALLLAGNLALTACVADKNEDAPNTTVKVTTYQGRDLLCNTTLVQDTFPDQILSYDCDFVKFYAEPDYVAPGDIKRIPEGKLVERVLPYQDGFANCLVYDVSKTAIAPNCDYVRFYTDYPPA